MLFETKYNSVNWHAMFIGKATEINYTRFSKIEKKQTNNYVNWHTMFIGKAGATLLSEGPLVRRPVSPKVR